MAQYTMPDEKRATVPLGLRLTPEDIRILEDISEAVKLPHQVKVIRFALQQTHNMLVAQGRLAPRQPAPHTGLVPPPADAPDLKQSIAQTLERLKESTAQMEWLLALQAIEEKVPA